MRAPQDFSRDVFAACLLMLCVEFEQAGLSREEIRDALQGRLRAYGGAVPFDPARQPDGAEVFVEVPAEGGYYVD